MGKNTNRQVIAAWLKGSCATNHRKSLWTNGIELWSYHLKIGHRTEKTALVADYTAGSDSFQSQTTSCHVNLAKREVPTMCIFHPRVWETTNFADKIPF